MKLLYNLSATQPIGESKFHGGGKYGLVVLKRLIEMNPQKVAVYYNDSAYLDNEIKEIIKNRKITTYLSKDLSLYEAARKESSVVYSPLFAGDDIPQDIVMIHTQHGLRILEMPTDKYEFYYNNHLGESLGRFMYRLKKAVKKIVKGSDKEILKKRLLLKNLHTITVSEHSKASILNFVPEFDGLSLKVFYSPSTIHSKLVSNEYHNPYGKYYLVVGANRWVKNGYRTLKALDEVFTDHPDLKGNVVVTGLRSWSQININIVNKDRFHLVGYVDEDVLTNLYRHAYLLVYGSLNEGFGYPPLEAMHEGCPVIASAIASIPEVCGDAVLYFNPYLISETKMRIIQLEDNNIRERLIQEGCKRQREIENRQNKDLEQMCKYLLSFVNE